MRALLAATLLCLMPIGCVVDPLPTPGTATDFKDEGQARIEAGHHLTTPRTPQTPP